MKTLLTLIAVLIFLFSPCSSFSFSLDANEIKKLPVELLKNLPPETYREILKNIPPDTIARFKAQIIEEVKKDILRDLTKQATSQAVSSPQPTNQKDEVVRLTSYQREPSPPSPLSRKDLIMLERVVILVHPSNPIQYITPDELLCMWTGKQTTWKECGWDSTEVSLVISKQNLRGIIDATCEGKQTLCSYNSIVVPIVANRRGAVGFIPVSGKEQMEAIRNLQHVKIVPIKDGTRNEKNL